jgi:hypothetical protein
MSCHGQIARAIGPWRLSEIAFSKAEPMLVRKSNHRVQRSSLTKR